MENLKNQFYGVMHKYQQAFAEKGVSKNLETWDKNKSSLRKLLSKHPNWSDQALAIVIPIEDHREFDGVLLSQAISEMYRLAAACGLSDKDMDDFGSSLNAATRTWCKTPSVLDQERADIIRVRSGVECVSGQKASRAVNRICQHYGLDKYTVEKEETSAAEGKKITRVHPYNAIFAKLSDALNPTVVEKTGLISVHPCDYLEMSNVNSTWTSCHNLSNGEYQSGCLSYMGDTVSMIFYTVKRGTAEPFYQAPRIDREVWCYFDGTLLQSRLYPSDNAALQDKHMRIMQEIISTCLGEPNEWKTTYIDEEDEEHPCWGTLCGSTHYRDYDYCYATVSRLDSPSVGHEEIIIGSAPHCTCCGEEHTDSESLKCYRCTPMVICRQCGQEIEQWEAYYDAEEKAYYCSGCRPLCISCNRHVHDPLVSVLLPQNGGVVEVCAECYEKIMAPCHECGVHDTCQTIGANRFCNQIQLHRDAA